MIFRRKKQTQTPAGAPVLRGRDSVENGDNPLARKFRPRDEPDTIDLQHPTGFQTEPDTSDLAEKKKAVQSLAVITLAPETGKIHVQPGKGKQRVCLDGEAVLAPTELRPGDRVQIGNLEFQLIKIT
jgi:hypothetical protein